MRICPCCKNEKPFDDYLFDKRRSSATGNCGPCRKAYQQQYHAANKKRANERARRWRQANPERHRENNKRCKVKQLKEKALALAAPAIPPLA